MSIFNLINICDPKPKMISLQEESPEIHSESKANHSTAEKTRKNKNFSLSKTSNYPKTEKFDLKLSYEFDTVPGCSENPKIFEIMTNAEAGQNLKKFIIETFKNEGELTLKEKLAFSLFLAMNINNFDEELVKEFDETHYNQFVGAILARLAA